MLHKSQKQRQSREGESQREKAGESQREREPERERSSQRARESGLMKKRPAKAHFSPKISFGCILLCYAMPSSMINDRNLMFEKEEVFTPRRGSVHVTNYCSWGWWCEVAIAMLQQPAPKRAGWKKRMWCTWTIVVTTGIKPRQAGV